MTRETFDTAINRYHRLQELVAVKKELNGYHNHKLSYLYRDSDCEWRKVHDDTMSNISEILDRHDMQIRAEIDAEIDDINKQIEEL